MLPSTAKSGANNTRKMNKISSKKSSWIATCIGTSMNSIVSHICHSSRYSCCSTIGTRYDSKYWFVTTEPSGYIGLSCSIFIHIYAFCVLYNEVLIVDSETSMNGMVSIISTIVFYLIYVPCTILALLSLFQATSTNPGAVPMGAKPFTKIIIRTPSTMMPTSTATNTPVVTTPADDTTDSTGNDTIVTPSSSSCEPPLSSSSLSIETSKTTDGNTPSNDVLQSSSSSSSPSPVAVATTTVATTTTTTTVVNPDMIRRCYKCQNNYKPDRAHHDSVTQRCIVKFDHYCPWVNNSIGLCNHKFFILFLFYTMLSCILSFVLLLLRYIYCIPYNNNDEASTTTSMKNDNSYKAIHVHTGKEQQHNSENVVDTRIHHKEVTFNDHNNNNLLRRRQLLDSSIRYLRGDPYLGTDTDTIDILDHHNNYSNDQNVCTDFFSRYTIIILLLISFIFMVFTAIMLLEQYDTIITGQSKIARMKQIQEQEHQKRRSRRRGEGDEENGGGNTTETAAAAAAIIHHHQPYSTEFNEMFGGTSPNVAWHWFLPIPIRYSANNHQHHHPTIKSSNNKHQRQKRHRSMKQVLLGYDNPDPSEAHCPYGYATNTNTTITTTTKTSITNELGLDNIVDNINKIDDNNESIMVDPESNRSTDNDALLKNDDDSYTNRRSTDGIMRMSFTHPSSGKSRSAPPTTIGGISSSSSSHHPTILYRRQVSSDSMSNNSGSSSHDTNNNNNAAKAMVTNSTAAAGTASTSPTFTTTPATLFNRRWTMMSMNRSTTNEEDDDTNGII